MTGSRVTAASMPGAPPYVLKRVGEGGDVPDLATGSYVLAVEVDLDARIVSHHVDVAGVDVRVAATQHVGHHDVRRGGRGDAERQVEHGPQVLLELGGTRTLD